VTRVRSIAGAFLFSDDDVEKKIGVLSGGERARVALARLLIKPGNLLLMDEPTNHLDLASAEALSESLEGYDGTLIFVSHNRAFIRRLATRIWNVADGTVETYPGTLDEYMDTCRKRQEQEDAKTAPVKPAAAPKPAAAAKPTAAAQPAAEKPKEQPKKSKNRVQKLERDSADLEAQISALEATQKERSDLLADPDVYADKDRSSKLLAEFRAAQPELEKLTARWEQVQTELDELSRAN
ncbi:MAG TPA: ATP-binding cassette domain-containing protein, partial [Polyangiales bacterium]|nr:ATP-binding cassette domain-containing protein [Polyangiales bacterium]